jgi:hypothetical protein
MTNAGSSCLRQAAASMRVLCLLPLWLAAGPDAVAQPPLSAPTAIRVEVDRKGNEFRVTAHASLSADPGVAWRTLIDYERLPEFVPGVDRTRVLAREPRADGEQLTVEYGGSFDLLFVSLPMRVWLAVRHVAPTDVLASMDESYPRVAGGQPSTLRSFEGHYALVVVSRDGPGAASLSLDYTAEFELAEPLPPVIGVLFGTRAIRHTLREQFGAMVAEIVRRSRQRESPGEGG